MTAEERAGAPAYPRELESDVALRDGSTVHIRPVRPEDRAGVKDFLEHLSDRSRYFRFFSDHVDLERAASLAVDVDYHDRFGLVATTGRAVVGHGLYILTGEWRAEVAFAVADALQGKGLGTILLGQLAEAAASNGIALFEARVLMENRQMADVFRESGFPAKLRSELGETMVELPTSLSAEALERFELREQTAAIAAVTAFLRPRSVAVIGASRTRGTIGGELFHNLVSANFNGLVYPVNPNADVVQSVPAYPSVLDIPDPVDLAVIAVPAAKVGDVARACGTKGVRALVVISSGFAEVGREGRQLQHDLVQACRDFGMRLIGPNCMGILSTAPDVRLNATFAPSWPPQGTVAFSSQSGALGIAVIEYATSLGLGMSSFVSVGNKADISGNDLIQYWEQDPQTKVILLYLESFGNPRSFSRISRRVGRSKPIVAVKSGRTAAGARATTSHTGALLAASDVTVDALFEQAGVVRTDTLAELFDVAALLATQPPPEGPRVGIVTNGGGLGILCADACEGDGLEVPTLSGATREALREFLPPEASTANPVDMIASASPEHYRMAVEALHGSGEVDAIIVIFVPPLLTRTEEVAAAIRTAAGRFSGRPMPVLTVFMSTHGVAQEVGPDEVRIPSYRFPEDAARAVARAARYGMWLARPEGLIPVLDGLRGDDAALVVADGLASGRGWLSPPAVAELLAYYGVATPEARVASTPDQAAAMAAELAGPVAVKAVGPEIVHKSELGAVRLGLAGADAVKMAAAEMEDALEADGHRLTGFLIQEMVPAGVEMLVGVVHDPLFGPVMACGAGGTAVELMSDVAVRITPLTDRDAHDMVRSLSTFPLLEGYRGGPAANVEAVEAMLLRVSAMVEAHPEIAEMDCNPVMVTPDGAVVVDARIRLEVPAPPLPLSARRRDEAEDEVPAANEDLPARRSPTTG